MVCTVLAVLLLCSATVVRHHAVAEVDAKADAASSPFEGSPPRLGAGRMRLEEAALHPQPEAIQVLEQIMAGRLDAEALGYNGLIGDSLRMIVEGALGAVGMAVYDTVVQPAVPDIEEIDFVEGEDGNFEAVPVGSHALRDGADLDAELDGELDGGIVVDVSGKAAKLLGTTKGQLGRHTATRHLKDSDDESTEDSSDGSGATQDCADCDGSIPVYKADMTRDQTMVVDEDSASGLMDQVDMIKAAIGEYAWLENLYVMHENIKYWEAQPGFWASDKLEEDRSSDGGLNYLSVWLSYWDGNLGSGKKYLAVHTARGTQGEGEMLADWGLYETVVKQQFGWVRRGVYNVAKPVALLWPEKLGGISRIDTTPTNRFEKNRLLTRDHVLRNVRSMAQAILEKERQYLPQQTTHLFCGHSLGGAVAGMVAAEYKRLNPDGRAAVIAFNSPGIKKVGERFLGTFAPGSGLGYLTLVDQHDLVWRLDEPLEHVGGQVCMAMHEPFSSGCEELHEWKDVTSAKCLTKWNWGKCKRYFAECFQPSHNGVLEYLPWSQDKEWAEREGGVGSGRYANQTARPGRFRGKTGVQALKSFTGEAFLDPRLLAEYRAKETRVIKFTIPEGFAGSVRDGQVTVATLMMGGGVTYPAGTKAASKFFAGDVIQEDSLYVTWTADEDDAGIEFTLFEDAQTIRTLRERPVDHRRLGRSRGRKFDPSNLTAGAGRRDAFTTVSFGDSSKSEAPPRPRGPRPSRRDEGLKVGGQVLEVRRGGIPIRFRPGGRLTQRLSHTVAAGDVFTMRLNLYEVQPGSDALVTVVREVGVETGAAALAEQDAHWRTRHKAELADQEKEITVEFTPPKGASKDSKKIRKQQALAHIDIARDKYHVAKRKAKSDTRMALIDPSYQQRWFCTGGSR